MSSYDSKFMKGDDPATTKLYGERTAINNCQYLLPYIRIDSNILDVGCGPGTITSDFAKIASQGRITGIDNSEGIIHQAKASFGNQINLSFAVGDAYKLDFPDDTFDIVHAHALLVHIKDPIAVLREFVRVVKPSGLIAVRDSSPGIVLSLKPDLPAIRSYWAKALVMIPVMGGHTLAGQILPEWASQVGAIDGQDGWKVKYSNSPALNASHTPRVTGPAAEMVLKAGIATKEELDDWKQGWATWDATDGAEFVFEAGELLLWKPDL